MRRSSPLLAFSFLLYRIELAFGRREIGLDRDLNGETPRPTSELLYPDEFNHGSTLMETRLGYLREGPSRRSLSLGARQITCSEGTVLSCPLSKALPCCPMDKPICCTHPSSVVCCSTDTFCNGVRTCCKNGQVPCTNPEGCCPAGATCCGIRCCSRGLECRNGVCVDAASISLSIASADVFASGGTSSTSSEIAETGTTSTNGNGNAAVVGGAVGGALGVVVLVLIGVLLGVLLYRRRNAAPVTGQRPTSSEQPITPASMTFSTNSTFTGSSPVTKPAVPVFMAPFTLSGAPAARQTSTASQQPTVKQRILPGRAPVIQNNYGEQSNEGSVTPTHLSTAPAPMNVPSSPSDAPIRGASTPAPPYSENPPGGHITTAYV